jgi:hypothetical protein
MEEHDLEVCDASLLDEKDGGGGFDNDRNKTSNLEMRWQISPAARTSSSSTPSDPHTKRKDIYELSSPSSSPPSLNHGLTPKEMTLPFTLSHYALWPLAWQTSTSFICSIVTFTLISYIPTSDCFLPLKLSYTSMFSDVLGQYFPMPSFQPSSSSSSSSTSTTTSASKSATFPVFVIISLRIILLVAFYLICSVPFSHSFSGESTDITAFVIVASTAALGSMLSRFNFARVAHACSHGYQIAPQFCRSFVHFSSSGHIDGSHDRNGGGGEDVVGGDGGYAVRQGISALSLFVFIGCYIGYGLAMFLIFIQLKRGWKYDLYANPGQHDNYPDWFKPTCSTRQAILDAWCVPEYVMVGCD